MAHTALKIAGGAVAVGAICALALPGISAQYTAGATAHGSFNTAATFGIDVESVTDYAIPFSLTEIAPGQTATDSMDLRNTSSIVTYVWIDATTVTTTSGGGTQFGDALEGTITTTHGVDATGALSTLTSKANVWVMAPGEVLSLDAAVTLPDAAGNEVLNQAVDIEYALVASQTPPV